MVKFKHIWLIILAICLVTAVGCTGEGGHFLDYQNNIKTAAVSWNIGDKEYAGEITYEGENSESAAVTVTAPVEIAGTVIAYSPEGATASVGSVSLSLPDNMGQEVYRIVRSLSLDESEMKGAGNGSGEVTAVRFEVQLYEGVTEYDITYGEDKYPDSATIKWDEGEMTVKYGDIEKGETVTTGSE